MAKLLSYFKRIGYLNALLLLGFLCIPGSPGLLFGYFLVFSLMLNKQFIKSNLDIDFVLIILFSTTYALFYATNPIAGIQFIFIYLLFPPTFYLLGKFIGRTLKKSEFKWFLIFMGIAFSLLATISVVLDIYKGGLGQASRSVPFFWTTSARNATGMAALFLFNMCIPAFLLSNPKGIRLISKLFLAFVFFISLLCVIRLGSRTQIGVMFFSFLFSLLYLLTTSKF